MKWSKHTDVDTFEVRAAYCGKHFGKIPTVKVKTKKDKDGVQIVGKKDGKVVYKEVINF